jgi:hypothetical protein
MQHKLTTALSIAIFCFVAGVWAGCSVGFEAEQDGVFPCADDSECMDGFECIEGTCDKPVPSNQSTAPPCDSSPDGIDQDGDGYGTGNDRRACDEDKKEFEDCNDDDPDIYPGAPQLCDGKANDCGGAVDDFSCEESTDCTVPDDLDLSVRCDNGSCVMIPWNEVDDPCDQIRITCDSSQQEFTYSVDGTTYSADEGPVNDCD